MDSINAYNSPLDAKVDDDLYHIYKGELYEALVGGGGGWWVETCLFILAANNFLVLD